MITAYHRPENIQEALVLMARPGTRPLAGGTVLNQPSLDSFEVVDLQSLGLDRIHKTGEKLDIGAMVRLQSLLESPHIPPSLSPVIRQEAPLNLRNMGTVAGTFLSADGRSPFVTAMLALDAGLEYMEISGATRKDRLGEFLPLHHQIQDNYLVTKISIPLDVSFAFEYVARSPADKPLVCVALARWPSGRSRLVLGGWGACPIVALDGSLSDVDATQALEAAAGNAAAGSSDQWAGAAYRMDVGKVLALRCYHRLAAELPR